jgi:hypothetical protein
LGIALNERAAEIRWSKGSCGQSGCTDPECVCALCAQPIGISEEDPRRADHDNYDCGGCEICEDDVPTILFRGKGKQMKQAAFHTKCFEKLLC